MKIKLFIIFVLTSTLSSAFQANHLSDNDNMTKNLDTINKKGRYGLSFDLGYLVSLDSHKWTSNNRYLADININYTPLDNVTLGIGLGIRYIYDFQNLLTPIYGKIQIQNDLKNNTALLAFKLGYSLEAGSNFRGYGMLTGTDLGYKFQFKNKYPMYVKLNYEIQLRNLLETYYEYSENINFLGLSIGYTFK